MLGVINKLVQDVTGRYPMTYNFAGVAAARLVAGEVRAPAGVEPCFSVNGYAVNISAGTCTCNDNAPEVERPTGPVRLCEHMIASMFWAKLAAQPEGALLDALYEGRITKQPFWLRANVIYGKPERLQVLGRRLYGATWEKFKDAYIIETDLFNLFHRVAGVDPLGERAKTYQAPYAYVYCFIAQERYAEFAKQGKAGLEALLLAAHVNAQVEPLPEAEPCA